MRDEIDLVVNQIQSIDQTISRLIYQSTRDQELDLDKKLFEDDAQEFLVTSRWYLKCLKRYSGLEF